MKMLLTGLTLALTLPRQDANATLDRALKAHAANRSVRAKFEQTLTNPLTGTTANAKGEFLMRKPDQLAVTFTTPKGDRIVADGKLLWVYLPSQNPKQVMRLTQGKGSVGGIDVIGQFFDNPRARYVVTDAGAARVAGRATRAIRLVPRAERGAQFAKAVVWIDDRDGQLRQFEVTDGNGLVRKVTMTRLDTNVTLPADAFRFIVPEGARVVEQQGIR